jgi:hypothetical protein
MGIISGLLSSGAGVALIIAYVLAVPFLGRWVAIEKGYSSTAWFWLCLFFGAFALLAICGAPNKEGESQLKELNRKFSAL